MVFTYRTPGLLLVQVQLRQARPRQRAVRLGDIRFSGDSPRVFGPLPPHQDFQRAAQHFTIGDADSHGQTLDIVRHDARWHDVLLLACSAVDRRREFRLTHLKRIGQQADAHVIVNLNSLWDFCHSAGYICPASRTGERNTANHIKRITSGVKVPVRDSARCLLESSSPGQTAAPILNEPEMLEKILSKSNGITL